MADNSQYLEHIEYRCALVAEKVYQFGNLTDTGIFDASPEQIHNVFGGSEIVFRDDYGFHAKLYYDLRSDQFILGFGGTTFDNINDWVTNFNQFFGQQSDQYTKGIELVDKIRNNFVDKVIVTGHSLGGGIAAVAAITGKLKGFVFNPPAIHRNTLEQFDPQNIIDAENNLKCFVVTGEILDLVNTTISIQHRRIGTKIPLYGSWKIPVFSGLLGRQFTKILVPNPVVVLAGMAGIPLLKKSINLHSMEEVFIGLKKHFS
ncbi:MAG: DUF2974 domain-containing protein [Planctomycetaceae bacterium]|jgi:pimeloyl-ACP methyl ester carboxylesterase|nr:DUF2974 domain-containing protein [Planctomycetaceae bacterium]